LGSALIQHLPSQREDYQEASTELRFLLAGSTSVMGTPAMRALYLKKLSKPDPDCKLRSRTAQLFVAPDRMRPPQIHNF
jgi:hypothetical protein